MDKINMHCFSQRETARKMCKVTSPKLPVFKLLIINYLKQKKHEKATQSVQLIHVGE